MSSFRALLKRIYVNLPIIRELRPMTEAVLAMRDDVRRIAAKELVELQFSIMNDPRYRDPLRLIRFSHQVYSQNGEDGLIAEICRRVGTPTRKFVEIGVGDGLENNTTALLAQGWSGWWLDGNEAAAESIRASFKRPLAQGTLSLRCAKVTAENISSQLESLLVPREFDLLSIDIDRNTYWVWAAMSDYKPRIAVIEYNATYPPEVDWKVDYRPELTWDGTAYMGASLKALELLGRQLGYALVGCDFMGVNAFFVREDLCGDKFATPFIAENHYEPPRYGLINRVGHKSNFSDY